MTKVTFCARTNSRCRKHPAGFGEKTKVTMSDLYSAGRSGGDTLTGISVGVWGRDHYNPTWSASSNASSDSQTSVPGNIAANGTAYVRWAPFRVRDRAPQASGQGPMTVKRNHRKYAFLFLSTD